MHVDIVCVYEEKVSRSMTQQSTFIIHDTQCFFSFPCLFLSPLVFLLLLRPQTSKNKILLQPHFFYFIVL